MIRAWILILAASFGAAQAALAQPEDTVPTAAEPVTEETMTTEQPAPAATAQGTQDAGAADDYRASEQISDDLSVSFPVDI